MENYPQNSRGAQQPQNYPQQSYPPPGYQVPPGYQPVAYSQAPKKNIAEDILKNPIYTGLAIAISVFLMWFGLLFQSLMMGTSDYNTIKTYMEVGSILFNLGMAGMVITLLFIGLGRHDYPQWVRFALIFGTILLMIWGFINILGFAALFGHMAGSAGGGGY